MSRYGVRPVVALTVALAVVTGCARMPTSSEVISSGAGQAGGGLGAVQVLPLGPATDASPERIVEGFLAASVGFSEDHEVARTFLTAERRTQWRPGDSTTVYGDGSREVTLVADDVVEVTAPVVASISDAGDYRSAAPGETVTRRFAMTRVDGQWRIDGLDDGILLTSFDLRRTYRAYPVYFSTQDQQALVPDTRWLPTSTDDTVGGDIGAPVVTALVRAMLDGPMPWLSGAVISGAPTGTQLALDAVPVVDGVAQIDLNAVALTAQPPQRRLLMVQLQRTLGGLPTVEQLQLTVEGAPYDVSGSTAPRPVSEIGSGPRILSTVEGGLVVVSDDQVARWGPGLEAPQPYEDLPSVGDRSIVSVATGEQRDQFAAVTRDGSGQQVLVLSEGAAEPVELLTGAGFTAPSYDRLRWVWVARTGTGQGVVAARGREDPVVMAATWLDDRQVLAMKVSRDGSRVVVASRQPLAGGGSRVLVEVAGIVRDETGRPVSLTAQRPLAPELTSVLDVAWVDEQQVVVLGGTAADTEPTPYVVLVGGPAERVAPVPDAVSVTAGNGARELYVGTASGEVLQRSGSGWTRAVSGTAPTVPG